MMIAILYPPEVAGVIAFVGASDPRELKREVALSTALFNRSQVALAVMAAGFVFHLFQEPLVDLTLTATWVLILAACLAAVADYVVNAGLVATFMGIKLRVPFGKMIRQLTIGSGREFVVSYLGLGILGLTLAVFYQKVGPWMLPAVLAPLDVRSSDVLSIASAGRGARGAPGARGDPARALQHDGGGARRRTTPDRRLPPRRPRAGPLPALAPGRHRAQAPRQARPRRAEHAAREDPRLQAGDLRSHPRADPRPAPVPARRHRAGRIARVVHRRGGPRLRHPVPPRRAGHPAPRADRPADLPHRARGRHERA